MSFNIILRLLIRLGVSKDQRYKYEYHYATQGFIYNLLKDTEFEYIHEKKYYKFFCFSNIFPISTEMKKGDTKYLLISSPNVKFIKEIASKLKDIKHSSSIIEIADMKFIVTGYKVFSNRFRRENLRLITATPIIVRIPRYKYEIYGIDTKYDYLYWRKEYPLELFIKQLEDNLYKKYKMFYAKDIDEKSIINKLCLLKQVSVKLKVHKEEHIVIGTLWEFWFDYVDNDMIKLLRFSLDCGFGERNSLGFGFINIK